MAIAPDPGQPIGPVAVAARDVARRSVPVVCYHQIRNWRAGDSPTSRSLTTPLGLFTAQMDLLAARGWTPITPADYYAVLVGRSSLPPKPVLLSFDDGHGSQWNAVEVLRRHGFPATFFPMTVVLDKPNWLARDQVRQLDRLGMTVGVHTYDHQAATKYAGQDWEEQLTRPKRELERLVGHPIDWFAYPFGLWNRAALPHLTQAGFRAAFQLAYQDLDPDLPLLTLRRFLVDTTSLTGFERQLASFAHT